MVPAIVVRGEAISDAQQRNFAASVLVVHCDALERTDAGCWQLRTLPLHEALGVEIHNWQVFDEANTPSAARAPCFSGVLLPGGWVLTALHGRRAASAPALLRDLRFLLGYRQAAQAKQNLQFMSGRTLLRARRVVCGGADSPQQDWALFQLDAPAALLPPPVVLSCRDPPVGTPLYLCGFPFGMPLRVSDGGHWLPAAEAGAFQARLTAFRCHSGAGVFAAHDHTLVGWLLAGHRDLRCISPLGPAFEWCQFACEDAAPAELCRSVRALPGRWLRQFVV